MTGSVNVWTQLMIGGRWVYPAGDQVFEVVCPSTEEVVGSVPEGTPADIDSAVAQARRAFDTGDRRRRSPLDRAKVLSQLGQALTDRTDLLANLVTTEMGAPILSAKADQVLHAFLEVKAIAYRPPAPTGNVAV